jgi:DNA-directed RNA polymerase subunit RPC12/RpoP
MMKCPHCGSGYLRRSHIRSWEAPFKSLTGKRPHRCEDCRWRGWLVHEHGEHGTHPRHHGIDAIVPPQGDPEPSIIDNQIRQK